MKKMIISCLLSVWIAFSTFAELAPQEQQVVDMMLSGDMQQLKNAAQTIQNTQITNVQVLDIAAEILLKKYPHAYSADVDTLSWVARAIGASGNARYTSVLREVYGAATERKLKRHTKSALGDIDEASVPQYKAGTYSLPESLYAKEKDDVRDARLVSTLLAGDLSSLRLAAKEIAEKQIQSQRVLDTAAEILLSFHATASENQIETLSWVAVALGQSTSGRYFYTLEQAKEHGAHRKLQKYAKKALKTHGDASGEQYKKGMIAVKLPNYTF